MWYHRVCWLVLYLGFRSTLQVVASFLLKNTEIRIKDDQFYLTFASSGQPWIEGQITRQTVSQVVPARQADRGHRQVSRQTDSQKESQSDGSRQTIRHLPFWYHYVNIMIIAAPTIVLSIIIFHFTYRVSCIKAWIGMLNVLLKFSHSINFPGKIFKFPENRCQTAPFAYNYFSQVVIISEICRVKIHTQPLISKDITNIYQ